MVTRCAQCNAPMSCSPQGDCWCADCPPVPTSPNATGCLCPECLREKLRDAKKASAVNSRAASKS